MNSSREPLRLRLLSWNVHGLPAPFSKNRNQRFANIAEEVQRERPDILALQEVWGPSVQMFSQLLPDYLACYVASPRTGASGGLALLLRRESGWSIEGEARFRRFTRQAPAWRIWQGDGFAGKGALFAPLRFEDHDLELVCTHLQSRYPRQLYVEIRRAQLEELCGWLDEAPSPLLLAGDLNTPADDEAFRPLLDALGQDVLREFRLPGMTTNYPTRSSAAWIDHIFVRTPRQARASLRLILNSGVDEPYSDHQGLLADVDL